MKTITASFHTGVVKGSKPKPSEFRYAVNYKGQDLYGKSVEQQLDAWVKYGVIEADTGDAIKRVCNTKEYLDLTGTFSSSYFIFPLISIFQSISEFLRVLFLFFLFPAFF